MKIKYCPICYEDLGVVETTPCISCGSSENSLSLLRQDIKDGFNDNSVKYNLYRAFEKLECTLCEKCVNDFMSYDPQYFGFDKKIKLWPSNFQFLGTQENPGIESDKYCSNCDNRLAFLQFVIQLREINNA
jgi:hypothetical protein